MSAQPQISDSLAPQRRPNAAEGSSRCVLVIDDSVLIREAVKVALGTIGGWHVLTACTGEEGIELAMSERPEAILLDVSMPGMDGIAVSERLRGMPTVCSLPVVLLTGNDRPEDQERFAELGVAGVITKPFDIAGLSTELATLLRWTT